MVAYYIVDVLLLVKILLIYNKFLEGPKHEQ